MVPAARVVGDLLSVDRGQEWFLPGSVVGDLLSDELTRPVLCV